MIAIRVRTPDIMCDGCTSTVRERIGGLPGVLGVTVSLADRTTSVLFDETVQSRETIVDAIIAAGFEVFTA